MKLTTLTLATLLATSAHAQTVITIPQQYVPCVQVSHPPVAYSCAPAQM